MVPEEVPLTTYDTHVKAYQSYLPSKPDLMKSDVDRLES